MKETCVICRDSNKLDFVRGLPFVFPIGERMTEMFVWWCVDDGNEYRVTHSPTGRVFGRIERNNRADSNQIIMAACIEIQEIIDRHGLPHVERIIENACKTPYYRTDWVDDEETD